MWINNNKEQSLVYKPIFTDCLTHTQKEDVEGFPPLNVDDCAEINRHFTPYIFYRRTSQGRYTCFCTSCNHEFKVNSNDYGDIYHTDDNIIRHNYLGTCPCCGVKAKYKAAGYKQVQLNEVVDFVIYKAVEEVVYIYMRRRFIKTITNTERRTSTGAPIFGSIFKSFTSCEKAVRRFIIRMPHSVETAGVI